MTVRLMRMVSGGGPISVWGVTISDVQTTPATAEGRITLETDGSITGINNSGATSWFSPAGGSPGNNYWVKFHKNSGDSWNSGLTDNTVYALTSSRSVYWSVSGGLKSFNVTISIYSDSGGTNLVGTGTLTGSIESS